MRNFSIRIFLVGILLLIGCFSQSCNGKQENIIGKWVSMNNENHYYECFPNETLRLHIVETGLNKKIYPKGEQEVNFTGNWWIADSSDRKYIGSGNATCKTNFGIMVNMYGVRYKWYVNVRGDEMRTALSMTDGPSSTVDTYKRIK